MSTNSSLPFRPAGLGGFHKKDVIAYIEMLANEFHQKEADLIAENKALQDKLQALETTCITSANEISRLKSSLSKQEELKARIEELSVENQKLSSLSQRLTSENQSLTDALSSVQEENSRHTTALSALSQEKQAIAELEIAAKVRAAQIENEAKEHVSALIRCCQKEFDNATQVFNRFKADASNMIEASRNQLNAVHTLFQDVEANLSLSNSSITDLADKFS